MADFTLRGVAGMNRKFKEISRETKENLSRAAMEEAEAIAERSRTEFVPIETGNLASTIKVVKGDLSQGRDDLGQYGSGSAIEVKIIAGDETTPQALAIHEHPSPHDPPSWKGIDVKFRHGGPKFLQQPLDESIGGMAERVGNKVVMK